MSHDREGPGRDRPVRQQCEWVNLPVGRQPLPEWVKGLHVDWADLYVNPPGIRLKTTGDVHRWPGQVWSFDAAKGLYWTEHEDGRRREYWHHPLQFREHTFWDRTARLSRPTMRWVTSRSEGLGGDQIAVDMDDGREAILWGPWCGRTPIGFNGTACIGPNPRPICGPGSRTRRWNNPWHRQVGFGGVFVSDDLLLRLIARFEPTLRVARVDGRLEPVREDWSGPKAWMQARRKNIDAIQPESVS